MDSYNQDNTGLFTLEIDESAKRTFLEMARWTKFLSIMGFIFLGLMVLAGIVIAVVADSLPGNSPFAAFGIVGTMAYFLGIAAVTFYPIYALLRFSIGIKPAIKSADKLRFNNAITALKNTFKYYGIMMIIFLGIYGVVIVVVASRGVMNT
jgi:hypothetical protein